VQGKETLKADGLALSVWEVLMTPGGRHQSFPFISGSGDSSFGHSAPSHPSSNRFKATHFCLCLRPWQISKQRADAAFVDANVGKTV